MNRDGNLCVLGLYVDDDLVVSQDAHLSEHVMPRLAERFNIKNLARASTRASSRGRLKLYRCMA